MTYTYRCRECDREWDADQRITDPPLRDCPHCAAEGTARRQISGLPAFWEVARKSSSPATRIRGRS